MIYILIPIFNEEGNVANLFRELTSVSGLEDVFYVFSDDGSSDQTIPLLRTHFRERNFVILGDGSNYGPGNAFNVGFNWILSNSTNENDIVVTMEADCTSDITLLHSMVAINKLGYDLVLASIYAQGGGFNRTSWLRKVLSSCANLFFRFVFDVKVLTISSFYRVYNVDLLRKVQQNYSSIIVEKGFICMLEVLLKCINQGALVIEVPMILNSDKRVGRSKMKLVKTSFAYLRFLLKKKV